MIPPWLAAKAAGIGLRGILLAVGVAVVLGFFWSWSARGREVVRLEESNARLTAQVEDLGSGLSECRAVNGRNGRAMQACAQAGAAMQTQAAALEASARAAMTRATEAARVARGRDAARKAREGAPPADDYNAVFLELVPQL